MMMEYDVDIE